MRSRDDPRASRIAISCDRRVTLTSWRFARLTQAMARTRPERAITSQVISRPTSPRLFGG